MARGLLFMQETTKERDYAWSIGCSDRLVQECLSNTSRQNVNSEQPFVPARIAVDLAVVRDRELNALVETAAGFARQAFAQVGVLLLDLLQRRRQRLGGGARG